MSVAGDCSSPRNCSGDMYSGVPHTSPKTVVPVVFRSSPATPKSTKVTCPAWDTSTLDGFQIPMEYAMGMGISQPRRNLDGYVQRSINRQSPRSSDELLQGVSLDEFTDDVRSIAHVPCAEDVRDVW